MYAANFSFQSHPESNTEVLIYSIPKANTLCLLASFFKNPLREKKHENDT
jgi:hypothetical protein